MIQNPSLPVRDATPEDLIRSTKHVTLATAKAVAAGNSCQQDDIITAANMGRKAVTEMLIICKVLQLSFSLFDNSLVTFILLNIFTKLGKESDSSISAFLAFKYKTLFGNNLGVAGLNSK